MNTQEAVQMYVDLSASQDNFTPTFEASRGRDWVGWGHKGDNKYPVVLLDLVKKSSLHSMIIKSKADTVSGQGFAPDGDLEIEFKGEQESFMLDADKRGNSVKSIFDKQDLEEVIFGMRAMLVVWDSTWSKIVSVKHVSVMHLRPFKKLNEHGEVQGYIYSRDWNKRQPLDPKFIPAFSTGTAAEIKKNYKEALAINDKEKLSEIDKECRTQIVVDGTYLPDSVYFGVPFYGAAVTVINTDIESDSYAYAALDGKLAADYVVEFDGITDTAQQNKTAKNFLNRHTGAKAANKPVVTFTHNDGKGGVKIIPIESKNSDKTLTEINQKTQQKLLSAHGVTSPMLVGIAPSGGLGNNSDLEKLYDLYQANIIKPIQARRNNMINKVNRINNWVLAETVPNINLFTEVKEEATVEPKADETNK